MDARDPRYFTLEERKEIERLCKLGMSGGRIAKSINRSKNGINAEIRVNGGKENYNAEKAHFDGIKRIEHGYKKLVTRNKNAISPYTALKESVDSLEMRMQILFELVEQKINSLQKEIYDSNNKLFNV